MRFSATAIAIGALVPSAMAWGPFTVAFCTKENPENLNCLAKLPEDCAKPLMSIERESSGKWDEPDFQDAFCTVPSERWDRIHAAMASCNDIDMKEAMGGYTAACHQKMKTQHYYICNPKNQVDSVTKELAFFICLPNEWSTLSSQVPIPSSTVAITSKPAPSGKPTDVGQPSDVSKPAVTLSSALPRGTTTIITTKTTEECSSAASAPTTKADCPLCSSNPVKPSNGTLPGTSTPPVVVTAGGSATNVNMAALALVAAML